MYLKEETRSLCKDLRKDVADENGDLLLKPSWVLWREKMGAQREPFGARDVGIKGCQARRLNRAAHLGETNVVVRQRPWGKLQCVLNKTINCQ